MTSFVFANNIDTTLAAPITNSSTSITLSSSANLPASIPAGTQLVFTLNDQATQQVFEILYAPAQTITGSTITVVRAQEGTGAQAWSIGDLVFSGPTAGQMESFSQGGSSGVTPGTYGSSTQVAEITVNANGLLTAVSNVNIAFPIPSFNGRSGAITLNSGDVTTALGYVPLNTAGPTYTGTLTGPTNNIQAAAGTGGQFFWRPNGPTSTVAQMTLSSAGVLASNPTAATPSSGIASFGVVSLGAFGGGLGLWDSPNAWGIYDITGVLQFGNASGISTALTPRATLSGAGAFTAATGNFTSSDERLKSNIQPVEAKCFHRDPYSLVVYDWRDVSMGRGRSSIAQNIQAIEPAYVHAFDDEGHLSVETGRVAYEQSIWCGHQIDALQEVIRSLQERVAALEGN